MVVAEYTSIIGEVFFQKASYTAARVRFLLSNLPAPKLLFAGLVVEAAVLAVVVAVVAAVVVVVVVD